jgi:endo-1,3(4)-beta-glucanase
VIKDMLGDKALLQTGLGQLKAAFATFAANEQKFPLVHESEKLRPFVATS